MRLRDWVIPILYAIAGMLWIYMSDTFLNIFFKNSSLEFLQTVQKVKGIAYVLVTSVGLYFIIRRHNRQIRESEKEYRRLFDELPVPLWLYDSHTLQFLHVNKATMEQYGYTVYEFKHMTIAQVRPTEDIGTLYKHLEKDLPKRSSKQGNVFRHKRKNGEVFFVRIHSFATTFKGRAARLVLAIDINEKVLAQNELKERNREILERKNYLRSLIDSSSSFLVRTGMDGTCLFTNQAFNELVNIPESNIINKNIFDFVSKDQELTCKKTIRDGLYARQKIISTLLQFGEGKWIDWEIAPILNEANERHTKELQWVGRDVTEKYKYLQELKEYREKLQDILSSVNDLICSVWSDDFSVIYINEASYNICGYSPQDFYNNSELFFSVIAPEDSERVASTFWQLNYRIIETSIQLEFGVIHRDGSRRHVMTRAHLKRNQENQNRFQIVATITDITALKDAEKRLKEIAYEQSHKVRQSVSILLGLFNVINWDNPQAGESAEAIKYLFEELERLDTTIKNIVKRTENLQQYGTFNKP